VRRERVRGRVRGGEPWRLLFASDLHLTPARAHLADQLIAIAARERVDGVLLGGDLIDRSSALPLLERTVRGLGAAAPVFAVAGNHDVCGPVPAVQATVERAGGRWLHAAAALLRHARRRDLHLHAGASARAAEGLHVLVAHHPAQAAAAAAEFGDDIAFAGHLHGGQCVWWQRGQRLYPGAWFSRWTGLRFELGATTLLVSRGVADTLPVRFRCPREVLLCELGGAP
jgi:predicted MPP superfamily phosphohydrolase